MDESQAAGQVNDDAPRKRLRERLIELRDDALGRMLRRGAIEPGHLPLVAGVNAALSALDGIPIDSLGKLGQEAPTRAAVSDDGREIWLTLYSEAGAVASVMLEPVGAAALSGRLIEAALSRLSGDG